MKNNKTLFVSYQYKRKGFFYFLCFTFLLHLPEEFITIKNSILPGVSLSPQKQLGKRSNTLPIKTVSAILDINEATALDLQEVYGIGPVYSKRIVKFRNVRGGFVHMDQLYQVYGLDTTVVKAMKVLFSVQGIPVIHKISVIIAFI